MVLWPEPVGQQGGTLRTSIPPQRAEAGVGSWHSCQTPEAGKVATERASTPDTGWGRGSITDPGLGLPPCTKDKQGSEQSRGGGFLGVELFTGS